MNTVKEFGETLTQIIGPVEVSQGFVYSCMLRHPVSCCWVFSPSSAWTRHVLEPACMPSQPFTWVPTCPSTSSLMTPAETVTESNHVSSWMEETRYREGTATVISSPFNYTAFSSHKINAFSYWLGLLILLWPNCTVSISKAHTVTNAVLSLDLCNLQDFPPTLELKNVFKMFLSCPFPTDHICPLLQAGFLDQLFSAHAAFSG